MSRDGDKKRDLLLAWWGELLSCLSVRLLTRGEAIDAEVTSARLVDVAEVSSIYVLFAVEDAGPVPVYVGKSGDPQTRWRAHISGLTAGSGLYARWRRALLDPDGRAATDLVLLVVPETAITRAPIPGFPLTVGAVEYQLVGLAGDAYPGRLLNGEGQERC
jgi:hypothetical protein